NDPFFTRRAFPASRSLCPAPLSPAQPRRLISPRTRRPYKLVAARFSTMRTLLSRTLTPAARRRKPQARLCLEDLESRLAPAVVGVNATANVHAIDPNVYGAAFASTTQISDLRLSLNRNGGNASDTYSLAQDATNHASDWFFESIAS